jgi:hypothetical protein
VTEYAAKLNQINEKNIEQIIIYGSFLKIMVGHHNPYMIGGTHLAATG